MEGDSRLGRASDTDPWLDFGRDTPLRQTDDLLGASSNIPSVSCEACETRSGEVRGGCGPGVEYLKASEDAAKLNKLGIAKDPELGTVGIDPLLIFGRDAALWREQQQSDLDIEGRVGESEEVGPYSRLAKGKWKAGSGQADDLTEDGDVRGPRKQEAEIIRASTNAHWQTSNTPLLEEYAERQVYPPLGDRVSVQLNDPSQFVTGFLQMLTNRDPEDQENFDSSRRLPPQLLDGFTDVHRWAREYFRIRCGQGNVAPNVSTLLTIVVNNFYEAHMHLVDLIVKAALGKMKARRASDLDVQDFAFGFDMSMSQDMPFFVDANMRVRETLEAHRPTFPVDPPPPQPVPTHSGRQSKMTKQAEKAAQEEQDKKTKAHCKKATETEVTRTLDRQQKAASPVLPVPAQLPDVSPATNTPRDRGRGRGRGGSSRASTRKSAIKKECDIGITKDGQGSNVGNDTLGANKLRRKQARASTDNNPKEESAADLNKVHPKPDSKKSKKASKKREVGVVSWAAAGASISSLISSGAEIGAAPGGERPVTFGPPPPLPHRLQVLTLDELQTWNPFPPNATPALSATPPFQPPIPRGSGINILPTSCTTNQPENDFPQSNLMADSGPTGLRPQNRSGATLTSNHDSLRWVVAGDPAMLGDLHTSAAPPPHITPPPSQRHAPAVALHRRGHTPSLVTRSRAAASAQVSGTVSGTGNNDDQNLSEQIDSRPTRDDKSELLLDDTKTRKRKRRG